jgi:hypothetical protein
MYTIYTDKKTKHEMDVPSLRMHLWAPSKHSGDSSLSPKDPNNSLTITSHSSLLSDHRE